MIAVDELSQIGFTESKGGLVGDYEIPVRDDKDDMEDNFVIFCLESQSVYLETRNKDKYYLTLALVALGRFDITDLTKLVEVLRK